jgi:hypothetical protein
MNRNELPQALHAALDHIENCIVRTFLTKETTHAWDTICAAFGSRPAESAAPGAVDDIRRAAQRYAHASSMARCGTGLPGEVAHYYELLEQAIAALAPKPDAGGEA